ncbi:arylsulfatase [Vibrio sp. 10N.286.49.B3]|uniref:TIGR04211 family SH3 domain-containing protein n=1 Tax=Vibrio sp. 10N.286.49.B3 TaxID=1880855 RepID=UPI000C8152A0|nr:TIGR04211 family SH3 domain-containing protein [Vibrio sp. 10N.286.49.B3]PMH39822.1 arylsulfatase [Vibrio sp. 10N.286.49.B3]
MKKLICLVLFTVLAAPAALAKDHYIADKLFTYMHAGPNNTFRIIGSINAGDKVSLLQTNKQSGYSEVTDSRGRKGWVETKFVSSQESMALRLPKIKQELEATKEKLANARNAADTEKSGLVETLDARTQQIAELEQTHTEISQQLATLQADNRDLRAKLDTQKDDLLLKYFTYGGGVAGIGLLFGLLLPYLIPRRKKSSGGGYNPIR